MKDLSQKTVAITGGGGAIGAATARRFADEGARVAVIDVNEAAAQLVASEIIAHGGKAIAVSADLSDFTAAADAVSTVSAALGPVEILVNVAGWDVFTPFLRSDPAFWERLIDINLRSVFNITHPVVSAMVSEGITGRVVCVASDAARIGSTGESVYAACKAGVIAFCKSLAREHARQGVTFNVVCPGATETGMFDSFLAAAGDAEKLRAAFTRAVPMGRLGRPEDIPGAILFFGSDDAAFITGQVLSVSGGLTMHG